MEENKKKIVVIDDEPHIRMMIQSRLEASGYQVVTAADGMEGLAKVIQEKPDLVIVDMILPKITGFEVCASLKLDKLWDVPIIMLTASDGINARQLGARYGIDSYISKPYSSEQLLSEVRKLLKQTPFLLQDEIK